MTATLKGILHEGREGSFNSQGAAEYTVTYLVSTDDRNDGQKAVLEATGLPLIGDDYSNIGNDFDPNAIVVSKSARQTASPFWWEVDVEFSTELDDEPETDPNPLNKPADISYSFTDRQIAIPGYYDSAGSPPADGKYDAAITASNNEPYDPQPEMTLSEPVLSITKNFQSINGAAMMALANTVNVSPYQNANARQLLLKAPQAKRKWHKLPGFYWEVSYSFHFRWETWDVQLLNQGTYHLLANGTKDYEPDKANPVVVNLTSTGALLAAGDPPTFTVLRVYREIDFNSLGLL